MTQYADAVFAAVDLDHTLERVAGGNETEVYRSDDGRYVVKVKGELGGTREQALACAYEIRAAAERYAACLGPRHSIPSHYLLARDNDGQVQVLVVQPYLKPARQVSTLDYDRMSKAERRALAGELDRVIRQALRHYRRTGEMPDLYGRTSNSREERRRNRSLHNLPERLWSFLFERTLLRSHNLMWTGGEAGRAVLVDYDFVRRSPLYRLIYFLMRYFLFWRDRAVILLRLRLGIG
jgi:hypothetical protein